MNNQKLFEFAKQAVWEQSGDGSVVIISKNYYKQLADEFYKYEMNTDEPYYTKIITSENWVSLTSQEESCQESISFSGGEMDERNYQFYDAVIILGNYVGNK
jgi:hypothetical protein